jgi:hypothetical protein
LKFVVHLSFFVEYRCDSTAFYGEAQMLQTIAILLIILWALGLVSAYSLGGLIHLLLVIAIIMLVVGFVQGRRIS